uniref:Secreted protein n=1 Tax=Achlya hypogyna TaxID=1202772 RepID=A0A0A7CNN9_ACHHY|nr:secreted protein [Achlya hypogyna]
MKLLAVVASAVTAVAAADSLPPCSSATDTAITDSLSNGNATACATAVLSSLQTPTHNATVSDFFLNKVTSSIAKAATTNKNCNWWYDGLSAIFKAAGECQFSELPAATLASYTFAEFLQFTNADLANKSTTAPVPATTSSTPVTTVTPSSTATPSTSSPAATTKAPASTAMAISATSVIAVAAVLASALW